MGDALLERLLELVQRGGLLDEGLLEWRVDVVADVVSHYRVGMGGQEFLEKPEVLQLDGPEFPPDRHIDVHDMTRQSVNYLPPCLPSYSWKTSSISIPSTLPLCIFVLSHCFHPAANKYRVNCMNLLMR